MFSHSSNYKDNMYPRSQPGKDSLHKSSRSSSGSRSNLTALINQFKADDELIKELTTAAPTVGNSGKGRVLPARPNPRDALRPTSRLGFARQDSSDSGSSAAFDVGTVDNRRNINSTEANTDEADMLKWKYDKNNNNRKEISRDQQIPVSYTIY